MNACLCRANHTSCVLRRIQCSCIVNHDCLLPARDRHERPSHPITHVDALRFFPRGKPPLRSRMLVSAMWSCQSIHAAFASGAEASSSGASSRTLSFPSEKISSRRFAGFSKVFGLTSLSVLCGEDGLLGGALQASISVWLASNVRLDGSSLSG